MRIRCLVFVFLCLCLPVSWAQGVNSEDDLPWAELFGSTYEPPSSQGAAPPEYEAALPADTGVPAQDGSGDGSWLRSVPGEVRDYLNRVLVISQDMERYFSGLAGSAQSGGQADPSMVTGSIAFLESVQGRIAALRPPAQCTAVHSELTMMAAGLLQGFRAIAAGDMPASQSAMEQVAAHAERFQQAIVALQ